MKQKKPLIIYKNCTRGCGKELASTNRDLENKYKFICCDCLTEDESQQLLIEVENFILDKCS